MSRGRPEIEARLGACARYRKVTVGGVLPALGRTFRRSLLAVAVVALALMSAVDLAHAAYMDCLEKARGRILIWNSSWEAGSGDNGVQYRITDVSIYNRLPDRSVTLTLKALQRAGRSKRVYKVTTEEKARSLCENLLVEQRPLSLPHEGGVPSLSSEEGDAVESVDRDLPFIRYTTDGWVRDHVPNSGVLEICRVLGQRFSCLRDEKRKFSRALRELEEEIKLRQERSSR
ncbi:MAG: hypothetical protein KDD69_18040 [Bdellovibrionales bacterium]|nr:hypothetical protein [Bdellovibrionales bacterium]